VSSATIFEAAGGSPAFRLLAVRNALGGALTSDQSRSLMVLMIARHSHCIRPSSRIREAQRGLPGQRNTSGGCKEQ
jgi:hypothetical protein